MSAKKKDEAEDILSAMVLSVSEREAKEVWMCESEKEREEAEEVGMKENDFLCGIQSVRRKERDILFFLIQFWKVQNSDIVTR